MFWLNGGPGCSSLGGFFQEHGPFVLEDASLDVTLNPYSWNVAANVLYIEQPAGIGFSYPAGPANDTQTASDTTQAIAAFLALHPELEGRPLYIAGESYGGHYVPNTAKAIEAWNAVAGAKKINLQGIAVGNGYADWQLDFNMNVPFARYHALSSTEQFAGAVGACNGDFARCFWPRPDKECPPACDAAVQAATENAVDGSIDIYDIYEDVCLTPGHQRVVNAPFLLEQERRKQVTAMRARNAAKEGKLHTTPISPIYPTCVANYNTKYLNLPAVQAAIHVDPSKTNPKNGGNWSDCGGVDYTFGYESEIPNYKTWTAAKNLSILIYSGDADFILNHMGSVNWITQGLQNKQTKPWTKWRGSDRQVAGYFEEYDGLTFLTVKGAGHFVPKDRPRHALDMLTSFLTGTPFDAVKPGVIPPAPLCAAPRAEL